MIYVMVPDLTKMGKGITLSKEELTKLKGIEVK